MRFLKYLGDVCLQDRLPVWATLLGFIVGALMTAVGAYWIVPSINQKLERQKIRSEFVIRNLDDLNARTRSLVSDISELHYNVLRTDRIDQANVQKLSARIAEMQWKAIELGIIFEGTAGEKTVANYQMSLDNVRSAISKIETKRDLPISQSAVEMFSRRSLDVIRELAALSGLRVPNPPAKSGDEK
jgi:hypothetical protein